MSEEIIRYEEVSPTAKLWRYMDLAKFISLIGKKSCTLRHWNRLRIYLKVQREL